MSKQTQTSRKTVKDIAAAKGGVPLVCLTAYDAPTAALLDEHADLLLVGDSVGMVVHGLPSTVGVTMEMMILHGQAVMRGSQKAFVVVDMPFGSYETNADQAFLNAARIMKETGCQAVKIESGAYAAQQISHLVERGVPVMGHVGLRPQAINVDGGFRAKGRTQDERSRVMAEARAAEEAGAFAIVIEGVAEDLAAEITAQVSCPTIGIGASGACDGQILVTPDMLGLFDWTPKFVRRYANLNTAISEAAAAYAADVRARAFPGKAETYSLRKPEA
ncbi:3-methyl-2-oxobutanoate hydroxymethyltransferase [Hyphomonas sp.]|uniref:3-methyl-2-oxobutanoate hydroxymethyltransferase n=1 Tax=Hyphomonas sp. TaxID=87 RepID=UPI0025C59FBD|nr:3-methyl-2-oxobutanoate hydroxymethyltransferase [Hyphomonas sp.]